MMEHPIGKLFINDGKIFERHPSNPQHHIPYLETPEISIIEKIGSKDLSNKEVEYSFKLNAPTCATWRELFNMRLDYPVDIHGKSISFNCIPANLEGRYNRAKEIVQQTNTAYQEEKVQLISAV
jgi:hypothetical protein